MIFCLFIAVVTLFLRCSTQ